jgi:hypothetical protein
VAPSRYQRTGQRTLHQDAETGAPTGIANTVPANKNDGSLVVRSGAPRCWGVAREFPAKLTLSCGSRMPAFTVPTHKNKVEVSRYRIPYSPARTYRTVLQMSAPSGKPPMPRRKLPTKDLQIMRFLRCLVSSKNIPYSTTSFTVPRYKLYRTHQQGIPYSPARNTVLTSKEYRTLPQNMTYPATKAARNVPAKLGKYVGERSERPVCVYC